MKFPDELRSALKAPLPGLEIQLQMMNDSMGKIRKEASLQMNEGAKKAAVFLLLYQKMDQWFTVLMQRPESPYAHSKQISFPGGRFEKQDTSLLDTALRETHEEFGISPSAIQPLGALSDLYIPVSNFWVQPYVGYMDSEPQFQIDPIEVASLIEVPLSQFLNSKTRTRKDIPTRQGLILKQMPCFVVDDKIIWGATAMILHEFLHILQGKGLTDLVLS